MKKLFRFRYSAFTIWIFSYTVILLLALTVHMFMQARAAESLKTEIYKTTSALLGQAQHNIDTRINDISKIAMQINWNANVKQLLYDNAAQYPADKYNEISNRLRNFQASNSFIEKIYIFPRNKNAIISQNATLYAYQREQLAAKYHMADGGGIGALLEETHYGDLVPLRFSAPSGEQKKIAFVQSLPYDSTRFSATLMILIDNSVLLSSMNIGDWLAENYVFVLDEHDRVLTTNAGFELPPSLGYEALASQPERFSIDMQRESFTVMQATSAATGWKYLFILPNRVLLKDLNRSTALFRISIAAFLVIGLLSSFAFARRNYFPLRRLTAVFEKESGRMFTKGENEFQFIENAIAATLGRQQSINDTFSKQFLNFRSSFVWRLLKNNLELGTSVEEALAAYNIEFPTPYFTVAIFHINEIRGESLGQSEEQRQRSARYIIHNVFEEMVNRAHYGIMVESEDMQAMLLNLAPGCERDSTMRALLGELLQGGIDYIDETFGVTLSVTVSNVKDTLRAVSEAYLEAYTAGEYDILMGNTGLTFYGNVEMDAAGGEELGYYYYYPLQLEVQFSNFIKAGNYDDAKRILDTLFHVNFEQNSLPKPIIRCFMFNLTSTIMKTIYEISVSNKDDFFDNLNAVEQLLGCQSVTEINMKLNQILIDLCAYTRAINSANNFGPDTEAFVESHYHDPNLDISMIAEHLSITSSYLSKKFKSSTGVGLLDYINQTRVGHARQKLRNTNESIADIASSCGFVNSNTFIRVFKKYEGVTPGRYREIAADGQDRN